MYEVMARRYRPGRFDELIGQEHIAATLKNAIVRDRVAHAYMFTGGHGCGKTTMARILAKALDCVNGPTPDPCCQCPICFDIAAGRDADVMEIDGASTNGIEQIRQLREQAGYVPTRAKFKIYIIDEVHMLSDGAFNALLKTLEEPPRHVKFILATTDPHKVPDTILSRCQRFDFRLVPAPKLSAFFRKLSGEENAAITDDALDAVASFSGGSVRDGLVLLDQLLSFADGEVTRQDVESVRGVAATENVAGVFGAVNRQDVKAALAIVDEIASRGTSVGDFLDQLIGFGRDLMLFAATGSADGATAYGPAREALKRLGPVTSLESALLYLDVLVQARTKVRSRALTNPLVALEMAVARLSGLGGVTPVSEILRKINDLPALPQSSGAQPENATRIIPKAESARFQVKEAAPEPNKPAPAPEPAPVVKAVEAPPPPPPEIKPAQPKQARPPVMEDRDLPFEPDEPEDEPDPALLSQVFHSDDGRRPVAPCKADFTETSSETTTADNCLENCVIPLKVDDVRAVWGKVVEKLREVNPAYTRYMARISVSGTKDDVVVLSGPPIAIETWEDERRLKCLREAVAEVLARPVMFEFVATSAKNIDSINEAEQDSLKVRLIRNPAVDTIRDMFEGVVVDCQPAIPSIGVVGDDDDGDGSGAIDTIDSADVVDAEEFSGEDE